MNHTPGAGPTSLKYKLMRFWPVLLGPAALAGLICIAETVGSVAMKTYCEPVSPPILAIATLIFALRAWRTGNPLCCVLAGLAFAFTCREIHFAGTDLGIKIALAVLIIWTIAWRKRLLVAAANISHSRWVLASAVTYLISKLIEKRVFSAKRLSIIPNEDAIHVPLEESMEVVAHLLLLLSAVMGAWMAWRAEDKFPAVGDEPESK